MEGRTVFDNLDKSLFTAVPIFIDSFGNFILLQWQYIYKGSIRDFYPPANTLPQSPNKFQIYAESLNPQQATAAASQIGTIIYPHQLSQYIDFAFLCLHGANGEDGSIQGILQWAGIPYTASGILPSAIGMSKAFQKATMPGGGFATPRHYIIRMREALQNPEKWQQLYQQALEAVGGQQMVIRPSNQGSSIGARFLRQHSLELFKKYVLDAAFIAQITYKEWQKFTLTDKIKWVAQQTDIREGVGLPAQIIPPEQQTTLTDASAKILYHPETLLNYIEAYFNQPIPPQTLLLQGFERETEIICEEFLHGQEFSCIVVRNNNGQPIALPPTEIVKNTDLYDYRSKYLPGMSRKLTPIRLPQHLVNAIRSECVKLFTFFRFEVYARIDGFINTDGRIYLNDPNTTSGMLPSSFFFHQAAEIGLNPSQFITFIIRNSLAERQHLGRNLPQLTAQLQHLDAKIEALRTAKSKKINVAVIMGGWSSERHISVESGRNIYEKLASSDKYAPFPVFLTGSADDMQLFRIPVNIMLKDNADDIKEKVDFYSANALIESIKTECAAITATYAPNAQMGAPIRLSFAQLKAQTDVVFIALHGRPGEDGYLQIELEKIGLPYNGSGVESSQLTIDKYATNQLLAKNGIAIAQQYLVQKTAWLQNPNAVYTDLEQRYGYPFIAKPTDDGCSSAVKKIKNERELAAYCSLIFREELKLLPQPAEVLRLKPNEEFPQKTVFLAERLIEKEPDDLHFLEVTGGLLTKYPEEKNITTLQFEMFEPSETLAADEVLSLEEKFLAGEGQNITPARYAKTPNEQQRISAQVRQTLQKAAQLANVCGYARIDAFVKISANGQVTTIPIEINSLPGMTPATAIFHQCALAGYTPYQFIDAILQFALQKASAK